MYWDREIEEQQVKQLRRRPNTNRVVAKETARLLTKAEKLWKKADEIDAAGNDLLREAYAINGFCADCDRQGHARCTGACAIKRKT